MKVKNSKSFSFLFIIFIVMSVMFVLSYQLSNSYSEYRDREEGIEHILIINKLDKFLDKVDEEKLSSAIYIGTKSKKDLEKLKVYRELVDLEIEQILTLLDRSRDEANYKNTIKSIFKNLNYIRARVDIADINYRVTLIENYRNKVESPTLNTIQKILKSTLVGNSSKFYYYIQLAKLKENLNSEKAFIASILVSSLKTSNQDLLLWENFLKNDITPNFYTKEDNVITIAKLNKIITPKKFSTMIDDLRGKIFMDSMDGRYSIALDNWLKHSVSKIKKVDSAMNLLISEQEADINKELTTLKDIMLKLGIAIALMFMLLITLIYLFRNNMMNNRLLVDTLKDIEADLDEKQRKEIQEVLKKNDIIEIYKFLANAIKEPSRAKDHFLANMSHEIRTPLNGIIGFTNILKESDLKEDQREFLNIIEESSNNLIHIVNDILDFSKVTSGKVEFENISFDVMSKFEATVDSYAAKAAQKNIELNLFIDPTLPTHLMGDATKISQIIINLLSNAIKFTDEKGSVDVRIEKTLEAEKDITLKFSVKDSGIGISDEQKNKIFDEFSQADASTSRRFGGTGLGLTISSKFVSLMGGKLEVESKEGEGSTFFFSIPLQKVEDTYERTHEDFSQLEATYITIPNKKPNYKNLEAYINYIGAKFTLYSYDEIFNLKEENLPNIIFIDHQYIEDEDKIASFLKLNTKLVLITTAEIEKCNCPIKEQVSKIIYKPINYSKTVRAFKIAYNNLNILKQQKVTKIDTNKINQAFKGVSALVVEDNVINQKLIDNILKNFNISVTIANNGLEALNLRKENDYDIIFMDIQMPIMSGVDSTKKIIEYEKENNKKHIPIVALTANTIQEEKKKYLSIGMDRYLSKPIDVEELTAILEEYFPLNDIRKTIPLQESHETKEMSKIILYKETPLTAKIYSAILNNLGYKVDTYSSEDEFISHLDNNEYKFALFDAKPFRVTNSDDFLVNLIKDSGATPIAFVEDDYIGSDCETLNPVGSVNEIYQKLQKCG
ncbi:MAG: response regulator [Epsilonproteobacteria bacterium]|nr:response regulator [Campylobacterota bacterium]